MADQKYTKNTNSGQGNNPGKGNAPKPKFSLYWIYGIIGLAIIITYFMNMGGGADRTRHRPGLLGLLHGGPGGNRHRAALRALHARGRARPALQGPPGH